MKKREDQDFVGEALAYAGAAPDKASTVSEESADESSAVRFTMDPQLGLTVEIKKGKKAPPQELWLAAAFEIVGRIRDPQSEGWARLLRWRDDDGRVHEEIVTDADLHADPRSLCARLASRGLRITTRPARAYLLHYLNNAKVEARVTRVPRTGWHNIDGELTFALPGSYDGQDQMVIVEGTVFSPYEQSGILQDWQTSVAKLAAGHRLLIFAIATAFAPPLLKVVGGESGGFNLCGSSSTGKTTARRAAASVWGRADEHGMLRTWRGTANGLEATAVLFSDTLLPLDELGIASSKEVASTVYSLAAGIGKARAQQDGSAKRPNTWRVIVLSTGELGIAAKISEGGEKVRAGQEIRILDIDADAGKGFGVFDHGSDTGDAGKIALAIREATTRFYGTAGRAFVSALCREDLDKIALDFRAAQDELTKRIAGQSPNGQISRAAQRFALTGAAGELAVQLGILPWPAGQIASATEELFQSWRRDRGDEPGETRDALEQIRNLLARFGDSRFDPQNGADERPVLDRLGWVRGQGNDRQWLIPSATWRGTFCAGYNPKLVARALSDRKFLLVDAEGKFSRTERIAGRSTRVYVLTAEILTDGKQDVRS